MAGADAIDQWAAAAEAVLRQLAAEMQADVRGHLDTPYPGPSAPGEDGPHKRTGRLHDGVSVDVARAGQAVALTLNSEAPYSAALEFGRPNVAARPFVGPALDRWGPEFASRLESISIS